MKTQISRSTRAQFIRGALCLVVLVAGTLLFSFPIKTLARRDQRTLTFAERVAYQRAIEDVYWRHRIWPKENRNPKPPLDAVMSQTQLQKKVEDYLRKSQALEDYWQRPVTADQLQAEMVRMAKNTPRPEVLRELFDALGNDPFVVAECLARPALADRLLSNWYAHDERIHGELKQRAAADLVAHPTVEQMKQASGKYSESEFAKRESSHAEANRATRYGLELDSEEWDKTVRKLVAMFDHPSGARTSAFGVRSCQGGIAAFEGADLSTHSKNAPADAYKTLPVGTLSPLQEDETSYYATAVIDKTEDGQKVKVAIVSWPKEPLQSWIANAEDQISTTMAPLISDYWLPKISDEGSGCIDDTWTATAGAPLGRAAHTAVWTGSEMIIWGGSALNTGGRYDPSTDTWIATSTTNAPDPRSSHTAVWTGSEMIVWGGAGNGFPPPSFNTGGRYNPSTDSWTATSTTNAPDPRSSHTAVLIGSEMIVWGGAGFFDYFNTGGRYNPNTDTWTATSTTNAPDPRSSHTAVRAGSEMIVWGGNDSSGVFNTGGRYDPTTNSWTATSTTNAPSPRSEQSAVWTGGQMIVWGGSDFDLNYFHTGGRYNPTTNSWTDTNPTNAPSARGQHTAVWTSSEMIVWGGYVFDHNGGHYLDSGSRYNPNTDSWTPTSITNAPPTRTYHTAVWTGSEMIVWGGYDAITPYLNSGGRYTPDTDSWTPTAVTPSERVFHSAVWTGTEMIIWGGTDDFINGLSTGGRYTPSIDSWETTSANNAPEGRYGHTAVWTGSEMIIWGGTDIFDYLNTGGRYNPGTDSWMATDTTNPPTGRAGHTALWAGSEMIVWGGGENGFSFNTGGRYNTATDSWTSTSTSNAPTARAGHTAVWTGSEMIVWAGSDSGSTYFDTGGRYNPDTDTWTPTSIANVPEARFNHTAVWTGSEMIVWGGVNFNNSTYFNTGGKYDPLTNNWTSTSLVNCPDGRYSHTAVWTGSEMVVWGGFNIVTYFNTGGRYNPDTDAWLPTSTTNAPSGRYFHTGVWADSEMIVWGGIDDATSFNTGGRYCAQSGPTPTPTPTSTASPSATATSTATPTATPTVTVTPSSTPRLTPTPRPVSTARARPTPPSHITPVPPPPSPRPTAWPRPTPPPHLTPVPTPSSPRPTPAPRP
jgi:N-acetylneuraminic acid mutarotase